jgi:hypothetical protein
LKGDSSSSSDDDDGDGDEASVVVLEPESDIEILEEESGRESRQVFSTGKKLTAGEELQSARFKDAMIGGRAVNDSGGRSLRVSVNIASAESTDSSSEERFKF